jgi:hypothetical protein
MGWNAHFLVLASVGAASAAGVAWAGRRGLVPGAALGFLAPLVYLLLWFLLDLPPYVGINL